MALLKCELIGKSMINISLSLRNNTLKCVQRKGVVFTMEKLFHARSSLQAIPGMEVDKEKFLKDWMDGIDYKNLSLNERQIHEAHMKAVLNHKEVYNDPFTTYEVFTILSHLNRGHCCGNACRHCPYKHVMVEAKYKDVKVFNTAFYS